ncbi:MAG: hypothetical protein ABIZ80_19260, partial [Bryobacteraceae bacterium]
MAKRKTTLLFASLVLATASLASASQVFVDCPQIVAQTGTPPLAPGNGNSLCGALATPAFPI